jgi:hypothetical protein
MHHAKRGIVVGLVAAATVSLSVLAIAQQTSPEDSAEAANRIVDYEPLPESVREAGGDAIWQELHRRADEWATSVGVDHMSAQALARNMDSLNRAILLLPESTQRWLHVHELSLRRDELCVRLPADHPYRGGEFCA